MSKDGLSDVELVKQFKGGNAEAYDAIVRRFQDRVFRLASVWLYDDQQATDVAQEVFIRGFKSLRAFHFRSAPFTWLYRTTKNVCHEFNRKRRADPLDFEPIDDSAIPESEIEVHQTSRRVRQLVSSLPNRLQEVVMLRIFEELSVKETARAMGCREGTVKALLHKAMTSLKRNKDKAGFDHD